MIFLHVSIGSKIPSMFILKFVDTFVSFLKREDNTSIMVEIAVFYYTCLTVNWFNTCKSNECFQSMKKPH